MIEYYFLYVVALIWIIFATIQDLKTEEIANWLSFSLIAFVLAYRGFYAIWSGSVGFFVYGLLGVLLFTVLAYVLYYARVFGGGDAKLLMGIGGIWPYLIWETTTLLLGRERVRGIRRQKREEAFIRGAGSSGLRK